MKHPKRLFCILMAAMLILATSVVPVGSIGSAEDDISWVYTATGNSGAIITVRENCSIDSVSIDNTSLAEVSLNGNDITVSKKDGAVGTATVSLGFNGTKKAEIQVPVGYTTFVFEGDELCVYEGSSTGYSVIGINSAAEEYTSLESVQRDGGGVVYSNTDTYKLYVEISKSGGSYVFSGKGNDMAIAVKKEATGAAELLLASLELSSSFTAPITVKKNSETTVDICSLKGHTNVLSDCEFNNGDIYGATADGGDGTNAEYAESAVIKGKAYSNITLSGEGTLNLICNTKNAVKVGDYGSITVDGPVINAVSVKHGISCDNTIEIRSGFINVDAAEDGIRTDPDAVDPSLGCTGNITVSGGTIVVNSGYDCIQAAQDITISGGIFNLTSGTGYSDPSFDGDTMSCKGIKASFSTDETSDTATADATNTITVSGGIFNINTPDDAVHSDAYISVTGGTFSVFTGDDGVHADTTLGLGTSGGDKDALQIYVNTCYEGLEAGTVEIYSGTYYVISSDDGINAAGDSTEEFNPGGGWPGGTGGGRPGQNTGNTGTTTSAYSITISGGDLYVNADGDGIDSNGTLTLSGGNIIVWGMASGGENPPLDCDSTLTINGATVFAAGSSSMVSTPTGQNYVSSTSSISQGATVKVINNSTTVFSITAPKKLNYVLYSSPAMTSSGGWSVSSDNSSSQSHEKALCASGHSYAFGAITCESGCTESGELMYVCGVCGAVKTEVQDFMGHAYSSEYAIDIPAGESTEGSMSRHCLGCDAVTDVTSIPSTDADEDNDTDTDGEKLLGDLNGDGQLSAKDSNTLMRIVAGVLNLSAEDEWVADINGDGTVSAKDSNLLMRLIVGITVG